MEEDLEDPANEAEEQPQHIEPKKPKVPRKALLNEERLISDKGLKLLYEAMRSFKVMDGGRKDLGRLMSVYRDWHFQLASRMTFENFLKKCRALGSKPSVKAHMNRVRLVHEGHATWEDFEVRHDEEELELKRRHGDEEEEGGQVVLDEEFY
jgi:hypothetical protein